MNDSNTTQFKGKFMISQNNQDSSIFNIEANIYKNESIIQIKKPFYGNVLKIEMHQDKKIVFHPSKNNDPFYVPDFVERSFEYWLRQCFFTNELNIYESKDGFSFKFKCEKDKNRTNILIEYNEFNIRGFLSKA